MIIDASEKGYKLKIYRLLGTAEVFLRVHFLGCKSLSFTVWKVFSQIKSFLFFMNEIYIEHLIPSLSLSIEMNKNRIDQNKLPWTWESSHNSSNG